MLAVVGEHDLVRAPGDALRFVEGGVADRQTVARRHIAIGVVAEGRIDHATEDQEHRILANAPK